MFSTPSKGFTLIETLVAISILLIVIIGPMTIAQKGIQSSFYASDQVTATFLAQEAIEAIREVRDNQALDALNKAENDQFNADETWDWFEDFENACDRGCAFDIEENDLGMFEACGTAADSCGRVYQETGSDGQLRYVTSPQGNGGVATPFRRVVTVDSISGENGAQITVRVFWNSVAFGGGERSVTLQTYIYDHYERYGNAP